MSIEQDLQALTQAINILSEVIVNSREEVPVPQSSAGAQQKPELSIVPPAPTAPAPAAAATPTPPVAAPAAAASPSNVLTQEAVMQEVTAKWTACSTDPAKAEAIKGIMARYGGKLTAVAPEYYDALLAEVRAV